MVETKALRKVLEVDLEKAKDYLQAFARLDTGRKGMLTYDDFRRFFAKEDTPELQNLFALLDTEDKGAIRFRQFLCGMAILNEQVGRHLVADLLEQSHPPSVLLVRTNSLTCELGFQFPGHKRLRGRNEPGVQDFRLQWGGALV